MNASRHHHKLPRSLCAAMAMQFAIGGAVIPFASLLFRDRGLNFHQISLIYSVSSATLLVFPFLWGMLADRFLPLNRVFALLNLISCVAITWLALHKTFTGMLLAFTLLTASLNPTFMLINALSFHHLPRPNDQFGRLRSWGSLGWIGPFLPISLWLLASGQSQHMDVTLVIGTLLCLAMVVTTHWLPHTPPGARHRAQSGQPHSYGKALKSLLSNPNYAVLLFSSFCVSGSFSILTYYSFPLLEDLGIPRPWLGPIQAVGVLFEFALFQWQATLLRRWNYTAVIVGGIVCLLVRQLLYAMVDNLWVLSLSYILAGAVVVLNSTGTSLLVNVIATKEVRSTAQTLIILCGSGLGPMFANWMAGWLSALYGNSLRPTFLFAAGLAGLAALLIALRGRALNEAGRQQQNSASS